MKTRIILLAGVTAMLLSGPEAMAQVKYGIHTGIDFSAQSELGELWNNSEICPGFMIGGFVEYKLGEKLSYQVEINYQNKGGKYFAYSEGDKLELEREFNYLTIPLIIKGTLGSQLGLNEKWTISGFAGPYFSYLTSATSSLSSGDITTVTDIESSVDKGDIGALFGGGVLYKLESGNSLIADLRYEMGLRSVDPGDSKLRNKVISLSVGYRF